MRKVGRPKNTPKDITNEICVQETAKGVGESSRKSMSGTCAFHPGMSIVSPKSPNLMYPEPEANHG